MTVVPAADVRCPDCSRLLARRLDGGSFEIRFRERYVIVIESGFVTCVKCDQTVRVKKHVTPHRATWGRAVQ